MSNKRSEQPFEILVGIVTRPHGLKGDVRILAFADSEDHLKSLEGLQAGLMRSDWDAMRHYEIEYVRLQRLPIVKFAGVNSIDDADTLRNAEIFIRESDVWELPDGQYHWYQLIGTEMIDSSSGNLIGIIEEIREMSPMNNLFIVRVGSRTIMIPTEYGIVQEVDLESGKVYVSLPDGLLELNS